MVEWNVTITIGITVFRKNNINSKIFVINEHFKMLAINLKLFGKLTLLN